MYCWRQPGDPFNVGDVGSKPNTVIFSFGSLGDSMSTRVVNIKSGHKFDQYIGRPGHGHDGFFGNPYTEGTREQNIADYKEYFLKWIRDDLKFKDRVVALKGKKLGCFCHPEPCHGDVIVEWIEENVP